MSQNLDLFKVTEIELSYSGRRPVEDMPEVRSPHHAYRVFMDHWDQKKLALQESFMVLLLNNNKRAIGISTLSTGGCKSTIVDTKLVFALAIKANANSIVVAHNHPSGNLKPSTADIQLTKKLQNAGDLLGITLDDHLILTWENYKSLRTEGLIEKWAQPF